MLSPKRREILQRGKLLTRRDPRSCDEIPWQHGIGCRPAPSGDTHLGQVAGAALSSQAWMELGRILGALHRELASDPLDFSDVAQSLTGTAEEPRWHVLATLQRRYLDVLHEASLWDVQTARRFALDHGEVQPSAHEIVLIGTVDLNRAQRLFLAAVGQQVTSLVGAPSTFAAGFDADGTLRSEFWQRLELPIDDDAMHVCSTVRDAADELAVQLASLGSSRSASEITIGVPDPTVIPAFQESLQRAGVNLRYGPGAAILSTQPMKLLGLIQRYLAEARRGKTEFERPLPKPSGGNRGEHGTLLRTSTRMLAHLVYFKIMPRPSQSLWDVPPEVIALRDP